MELTLQEIVIRLGVATILSGIIGIEREVRQKPAGVRTNALIGLGSAAMSLAGVYAAMSTPATTDVTRIASVVVQGIGFLGAGAIIQSSGSVRGLTTAATMWVVAGIGIACGLGLLQVAMVTALIVLVLLAIFGPIDARLMHDEVLEGEGLFRKLVKGKKKE
ncbi:MgtC/SapB family protein [Candidatus Uhrbacteria bacterium]|nr:MgtC/SapB family protein [Candidatus Uhrbacteria bacterium]